MTLDNNLPRGENWHEQLLQQMAKSGSHACPQLWEQTLLADLKVYRRFRHRVRHMYNLDLDSPRVLELAQHVPGVFANVQRAVKTFSEWLVQQTSCMSCLYLPVPVPVEIFTISSQHCSSEQALRYFTDRILLRIDASYLT